jgi:hypothetical protein
MSPTLPGSVVHFDVCGPDALPLSGFYAALFGWKVLPKGPGYSLIQTPGPGPNGAVVETEAASLTMGVVVSDLEQSLRQVTELGGTVTLPPTDNGWVKKAQITDPAGNTVTLIQG